MHDSTITAAERDAATFSASPSPGNFLLAAFSLWEREMFRFLRQPSRIIGLIAAPLLFWFFLGSGLGATFRPQDPTLGGSLQYLFPGTVVLIVLFASVFSNMSTIEDRREGYLLSVLVAPISRAALVVGKIMGGTIQGLIPGLLFLMLAPLAGFHIQFAQALEAALVLFVIALSLSGLGFVIAWRMDSAQGFHAVLNLVLMPAWVLSGALFPASGASSWMRGMMQANPLTYEVHALRAALMQDSSWVSASGFPLNRSLEFSALFALVIILVALIGSGRPSVKHLT